MSQQSDVLKAYVTRYEPEPEQKEQPIKSESDTKESGEEDQEDKEQDLSPMLHLASGSTTFLYRMLPL